MGQLQPGYGLQDEFFAVSRGKALSLSNLVRFAFYHKKKIEKSLLSSLSQEQFLGFVFKRSQGYLYFPVTN